MEDESDEEAAGLARLLESAGPGKGASTRGKRKQRGEDVDDELEIRYEDFFGPGRFQPSHPHPSPKPLRMEYRQLLPDLWPCNERS